VCSVLFVQPMPSLYGQYLLLLYRPCCRVPVGQSAPNAVRYAKGQNRNHSTQRAIIGRGCHRGVFHAALRPGIAKIRRQADHTFPLLPHNDFWTFSLTVSSILRALLETLAEAALLPSPACPNKTTPPSVYPPRFEVPDPAYIMLDRKVYRARMVSSIAATLISLACGTNVGSGAPFYCLADRDN